MSVLGRPSSFSPFFYCQAVYMFLYKYSSRLSLLYVDVYVLCVHSVDTTRQSMTTFRYSVSTLYTISYLYLYVGLLPSRDPHTLVNGRQVLLYCINTPLFIRLSFALLPRGYIYIHKDIRSPLYGGGRVYENFSGADEWIDPSLSLSLGTLLTPLFFDILSGGRECLHSA